MFLTAPALQLPGITHGFFTRQGGVSEGIYASLNCGRGSSDNPAHVSENRKRVVQAMGVEEKNLCSLYQIHSSNVLTVTQPWRQEAMPQADAMVTTIAGLALGILTADCVPVLFADARGRVIGAAHAGWKGAIGGVIANTVSAMQALGAQDIIAAIGPCIGATSYEVGDDFRARFLQESAQNEIYFAPAARPAHALFDIRRYVAHQLTQTGVKRMNILENDTYLEEDAFFSFRRTTHRNEPDYGRQLSAITLTTLQP